MISLPLGSKLISLKVYYINMKRMEEREKGEKREKNKERENAFFLLIR